MKLFQLWSETKSGHRKELTFKTSHLGFLLCFSVETCLKTKLLTRHGLTRTAWSKDCLSLVKLFYQYPFLLFYNMHKKTTTTRKTKQTHEQPAYLYCLQRSSCFRCTVYHGPWRPCHHLSHKSGGTVI